MRVNSEAEMIELGRLMAAELTLPAVIELLGDVGVGKTTFTRGLAQGLGVDQPVTSPSFTISKRYAFPLPAKCCKNYNNSYGELVHYDFYRLPDPGLMSNELADTLANPATITVIEWGNDVASLLPASKIQLEFRLLADGSRELQINDPSHQLPDLWKTCGKLSEICAKLVENSHDSVQKSASDCAKTVEKSR